MYIKNLRRAKGLVTFLLPALAIPLALTLVATQAQAKPNFSGEWKLNPSKSEFGPMPAPSKRTDKITHEDPKLQVTTSSTTPNGDFSINQNFTTDGKECTNEIRGNPMKSIVEWEGDALVFKTKGSFGGNEINITDKWTLTDEGKTLIIGRHFKTPQGEMDQKIVLEKQ
jgi:hypothetical protein